MKLHFRVLLLVALALLGLDARAQEWESHKPINLLNGKEEKETIFVLKGKFLTRTKYVDEAPELVLFCEETPHMRGRRGAVKHVMVQVGGVVDTTIDWSADLLSFIAADIRYSMDNGKIHEERWLTSKDHTSILPRPAGFMDISDMAVNDFFYNHTAFHKLNTSPMVRVLKIEIPQAIGDAVVVEFDFPDSTEQIADRCGVILH